MTPSKKIYLCERELKHLPSNYSKERSHGYHSDTALREWIENNQHTEDFMGRKIVYADELLKFLNG